ncbi:MAG: hypothetical protein JO053_10990 [Acidobacteria bacterium]|nr:hypothetical protein [Acidobacteriota bacterium]
MREGLFILAVIVLLFGLTLLRYRKQIGGLIEFGKALKDVKASAARSGQIGSATKSGQLVNCTKCGVWIPQNKAIHQRKGEFYCSNKCVSAPAER